MKSKKTISRIEAIAQLEVMHDKRVTESKKGPYGKKALALAFAVHNLRATTPRSKPVSKLKTVSKIAGGLLLGLFFAGSAMAQSSSSTMNDARSINTRHSINETKGGAVSAQQPVNGYKETGSTNDSNYSGPTTVMTLEQATALAKQLAVQGTAQPVAASVAVPVRKADTMVVAQQDAAGHLIYVRVPRTTVKQ